MPTILLSWLLGDKINNYFLYKERCKELRGLGFINGLDSDYSVYCTYSYFSDLMSENEYKKCLHISQSRSKKRKRCFDNYITIERLAKLTGAKMLFGTITFNQKTLNDTYENRKKKLQRYLKKYFFYVIKNADYGDNTERLHYHFIGLTFNDLIKAPVRSNTGRVMYNIPKDYWKSKDYGHAPNYEIIAYDMKDKKRLSNYIVKLNNHSNKQSVKRTRLSVLKNKNYLDKHCIFADVIL